MHKLAVAVLASMALPVAANAATIFGVDENNRLVTFDSANPGTFLTTTQITGTAGNATFLAIDFRGSNGLLYGLTDDYGLYTINTSTAVATLQFSSLNLAGTNFGFDFNDSIDRLRIVSNLNDNYVVNADTGEVSQFTDVFFAPGDPNAGVNPVVTGNGYLPWSPTQFAIDTATDSLVTQANNEGTLQTIGSLGVAVGPRTSFDIAFDGTAYMHDVNRFYTVDLTTGLATLVGTTQYGLFGIAASPDVIPEPGTWAMMLLGFGGLGMVIRRRKRIRTSVAYA